MNFIRIAATLSGPITSGALVLALQTHDVPSQPPDASSSVPARHTRALHKGHIELSNGVYIREDDDFVVQGDMPIVLRRTYLSGDHVSRQFGIGTTHSGEWYLHGEVEPFNRVELILADGGRIRFDRVTPGTGVSNAVLRHDSTPTDFRGAILGWVGWQWAIAWTDGRIAAFRPCGPGYQGDCSLVDMRDADHHITQYVRDANGRLNSIQSGGAAVFLDYDDHGRIVLGRDTTGRKVNYQYDGRGRLVRVETSDGIVRTYSYDDRDRMRTIDENDPKWLIENTYDDNGRVVRQVTRDSEDDDDPATLSVDYMVANGTVTGVDVTEYDGTHTVTRFSENGYEVSEILDARGPRPVSVTYDRSDASNVASAMTIRCMGDDGHVVRTLPTSPGLNEDVRDSFIQKNCR